MVLLHFSDWNYQDKYYQLSEEKLLEFQAKIRELGMSVAWQWFHAQVNYGDKPELPIECVNDRADHTLEEFFLDFLNPEECLAEWDERS